MLFSYCYQIAINFVATKGGSGHSYRCNNGGDEWTHGTNRHKSIILLALNLNLNLAVSSFKLIPDLNV